MKATYRYILFIIILTILLLGLTACMLVLAQDDEINKDNNISCPTEPETKPESVETPSTTIPTVSDKTVNVEEIKPTRYDYREEAVMLAKLIYREARGIKSITEQANVAWTVINRVESSLTYYPDSIKEVITQPGQFAWNENTPTVDDYGRDLVELAQRILLHWAYGDDNGIHRTLPQGYYYFYGDGVHNHFTNDYDLFLKWCKTKNFAGEWDYSYGYLMEDNK